jgi:sulfur relay (sulfurtransferase) complex TusBCD TusD component (DsrE family)
MMKRQEQELKQLEQGMQEQELKLQVCSLRCQFQRGSLEEEECTSLQCFHLPYR